MLTSNVKEHDKENWRNPTKDYKLKVLIVGSVPAVALAACVIA